MALLSVLCTLGHAAAAAQHRAATHTRLGCQIAAPAGAGGIAHAITHERWSASVASTVAALLDLNEARAAWLCEFGAVYVGGERAIDPAALIGASTHLRVHTTPRLYPAADSTDWLGSIVHDSANFVILDKPRGVPTHAAVDNAVQTCQARLSAALGVPLGCPHRLDVQTRGLLVLSKSAKFLEGFNRLLRDRRGVRKGYRALCEPSLGDDTPIPPLVSEGAHDSAGEVQVTQASNGVIQRIAIPAKVSDGFLGLVASELEFYCPLGSQERYSYALSNERLWR